MRDVSKKYRSYGLAIKTEEDGYNFYKKISDEAENKLIRETFKSFAADEMKHKEIIINFYNALENNEAVEVPEKLGACSSIELARTIFERADEKVSESVKSDSDVIESYKMASKLEDEGIKFYKQLHESTISEKEKELYGALMHMEEKHKEMLDNMIDYLNNPGDWFFEQERWTIEG